MQFRRSFSRTILSLCLILGVTLSPTLVLAAGNQETAGSPPTQESIQGQSSELPDAASEVSTPQQSPQRIVSLAPNVTEILFALGIQNRLVGRTDFCDYPAGVSEIPSIGGGMDAGVEGILALKPDLVIAPRDYFTASVEKLQDLSIPVLILDTVTELSGVFESISGIAQAAGVPNRGDALVQSMKERLQILQTELETLSSPRPRVYYAVGFGDGGDWTAGGDTYIHQMITLAGGENIAADVSGWSYSLEKLLEHDPELVLLPGSWPAEDAFKVTPGYSSLTAVTEDRLYTINNDLIDRQGPRSIDGLVMLASIFHPDLSPEVRQALTSGSPQSQDTIQSPEQARD
ncbi:ABC transporter substrate-binding protein [Spirochaeta lutea]|uniref:ABC transporter substrate-binding protein n=1 Tax=Spirochaeta lutea TaxID=1480694 RepID=UPI000689D149|nr:ABC transporter substrate-binding protein [Spirochaeta lutea]